MKRLEPATGDPRRFRGASCAYRWECTCTATPVLLAMVVPNSHIEIKMRDRFYRVESGRVDATCPKCGQVHSIAAGIPTPPPVRIGGGPRR